MISDSVDVSSADVASSKQTTGASLRTARASATRCFSPPESLSPRSPTTVSKRSGRESSSGVRFAARAAASTAASDARGSP